MEFPHLQEMYAKLKDQGFTILAVNQGDAAKVIADYAKEGPFTFPLLMNQEESDNDVPKMYGVMAYPTNYVIGPDGKILSRCVGYDEESIKGALEKAGLKLD